MDLRVFARGDLIIDKKLKSHGLIVKTEAKTITIKWFKSLDLKKTVGLGETMLTKEFIRKQIMKGEFIHQEGKKK